MFVPLVLSVLLSQMIIAALSATVAAADSNWLMRTSQFLVAYTVLFGGYILATVWFSGDYWALLTLEPVGAGSHRDAVGG